MKNLIKLIMLLLIGLFLNSCYYDAYPEYEDIDTGGGDVDIPTEVFFGTDIQPLFVRCTGCHKGGFPDPDLRDGESYSALVPTFVTANNSNASSLMSYLPGTGHHDVGFNMSNSEIALLKAWIDQGAKNN